MFDTAFIQEEGSGRLSMESRLVRDHCVRTGQGIRLFTRKLIQRRNLPLTRRDFVFGDIDCMHGAMRQLEIRVPEPCYYPKSLTGYLHGRVWLDTVGGLRRRIEDERAPVFAKPASRAKRFTGRVFASHADFYFLGTTGLREPVWCSEIVDWKSEFRVYVIGNRILSIDHYDGDDSSPPDIATIEQAIADFEQSGEAPVAYGIDFGVLASGETALVEANEGYGLGAYAIGSEPYTELMFARWRQLISLAETS